MNREEIERALARGAEILSSFFPAKPYLLFPILYSACVWAVRRVFNYRDHLLTWQVWLDPETVRTKPDDFILYFFMNEKALSPVYEEEIRARDMGSLREAFAALYPVCGLEDAFLRALFRDELARGEYKKIAAEFTAVVSIAKEDIGAAKTNRDLWKFLENLGIEVAALGIHLLKDESLQDLILEAVREKPESAVQSK